MAHFLSFLSSIIVSAPMLLHRFFLFENPWD
jgi:hypothetical protein